MIPSNLWCGEFRILVRCAEGEGVEELRARKCQDTATCNFTAIKDPQDKAMHARLIYSVGKGADFKALINYSDDDLRFCKVDELAFKMEDAS